MTTPVARSCNLIFYDFLLILLRKPSSAWGVWWMMEQAKSARVKWRRRYMGDLKDRFGQGLIKAIFWLLLIPLDACWRQSLQWTTTAWFCFERNGEEWKKANWNAAKSKTTQTSRHWPGPTTSKCTKKPQEHGFEMTLCTFRCFRGWLGQH